MESGRRKAKLDEILEEHWQQRADVERRSDPDKRISYDLEYFIKGGKERRQLRDRREAGERRDGWLRVGRWRSVSVFDE